MKRELGARLSYIAVRLSGKLKGDAPHALLGLPPRLSSGGRASDQKAVRPAAPARLPCAAPPSLKTIASW